MSTHQHKPGEEQSFVEHLAQTLGVETNATHIFAPPVERDGVTVIPVAKARYGFGGGGGKHQGEEGSGGGGGAVIVPAGYIEIANGSTRYHPIRNPLAWLPVIAAGGAFSLLALRSLTKLLRQ